MKKALSIIAGCLLTMTSLFACVGYVADPTPAPATSTPVADSDAPARSTTRRTPFRALPRTTPTPRADMEIPRNLVPDIDKMPGRMVTPNTPDFNNNRGVTRDIERNIDRDVNRGIDRDVTRDINRNVTDDLNRDMNNTNDITGNARNNTRSATRTDVIPGIR